VRGRKPKPPALRLLDGDTRKQKGGNTDLHPEPPHEIPSCPSWLADEAKKEWRRTALILHDMGVLSLVDRAALASYCQWWARYVEAERHIAEEGSVVDRVTTQGATTAANPWIGIRSDAMKHLRALASEFGFTPTARGRISVGKKSDAKDPLEKWMHERQQRRQRTP